MRFLRWGIPVFGLFTSFLFYAFFVEETPSSPKTIRLQTKSGTAKALLFEARKKSTNYVLLFHDIYGISGDILADAKRLQQKMVNVNVIVPDFFSGKAFTNPNDAAGYISGKPDSTYREILTALKKYIQPGSNVICLGRAWGAKHAFDASALFFAKSGCILYYYLPPVVSLQQMNGGNVLMFFGNQDLSISAEEIHSSTGILKNNNCEVSSFYYDSKHGFYDPKFIEYDETASADSFIRCIAFIHSYFTDQQK